MRCLVYSVMLVLGGCLTEGDMTMGQEHLRVFACNYIGDLFFQSSRFKSLIQKVKKTLVKRQTVQVVDDSEEGRRYVIEAPQGETISIQKINQTAQNIVLIQCLMKLKLQDFQDIPDIFYSGSQVDLDQFKSHLDPQLFLRLTLNQLTK